MNPEQILAALSETYSTCASYMDTGEVVSLGAYPTTRPFRTAFVRPDWFRFEFRDRFDEADPWHSYVVWANESDVRVRWDIRPQVEQAESLRLALAGATGVSGGAAHTIPSLLMPDLFGPHPLTRLADVTSLPDEMLAGVACYRLVGRAVYPQLDPGEAERRCTEAQRLYGVSLGHCEHEPLTLWIDRGTFLIRRIEESVRSGAYSWETVITYEPRVGVQISEAVLRFDPPAGGTT
jgi:hypothetical protein